MTNKHIEQKHHQTFQNSGLEIADHFEDLLEMVYIGSGAKRGLENVELFYYEVGL